MMRRLNKDNTRRSAVEYIEQQLREGNSLAKLLLETLDFGVGDVITLSPTPVSPTEATQFKRGHAPRTDVAPQRVTIGDSSYLAFPIAHAHEEFIDVIYNSLTAPGSVCLMQNWLFDASAAWLTRAKSVVITHGNEVYHLLTSSDRDRKRIEDARREAERLPVFTGAIGRISADESANIASLKAITTTQLAAFAETVQSVFVGAYDGEGYVVWNKPSR